MEEIGALKLSGPDVDLSKVPALNHRRSVTFINHFITQTTNFLNNFAAVTEEQLSKQSLEMQKLEIALKILEAKLESIPGLDDVKPNEAKEATIKPTEDQPPTVVNNDNEVSPSAEAEPETPVENFTKVKDDPRYAKYLKMVNVGVPKAAIGNKMKLEGLDPSLLDTPDAPAPDAPLQQDDSSEEEFSSDDEFSD